MPQVSTRSVASKKWKSQRNSVLIVAFGVVVFLVLALITAFVNQSKTDFRSQAQSDLAASFKTAEWECYDGKTKSESFSRCRTNDDWKQRAEGFCRKRCDNQIGKCGVNTLTVSQQCAGSTPAPSPIPSGCQDSDGGRKVYISGKTLGPEWGTGKDVTKSDYCIDSGSKKMRLVEYYCRNDMVASQTYVCQYGCVDGRCLDKGEKPMPGTPSPTPQIRPTPTPSPKGCHSVCQSSNECQKGLECRPAGNLGIKTCQGSICPGPSVMPSPSTTPWPTILP